MFKIFNIKEYSALSQKFQLCEAAAKGGITVVHNETGKINTYAFKGKDWLSYDSSVVIKRKVCLYVQSPLVRV